jgi:hypothetical protein
MADVEGAADESARTEKLVTLVRPRLPATEILLDVNP